jgi:hypothetical protein
MTNERTVQLNLGDWSGDGHNITETVLVTISGDDVSNKALESSRKAAEDFTGVSLKKLFSGYEDSELSEKDLKKLILSGLPCLKAYGYSSSGPNFIVDEDALESLESDQELQGHEKELAILKQGIEDEDGFEVLTLLMTFFGYGITNFSYKPLKLDVIVGNYAAPLPGFGYGLYFA